MIVLAALLSISAAAAAPIDLFADTWAASDALGRKLPVFPEVPAPRAGRTAGIFYFLWHGAHIQGGPYDISKILAADPEAMQKPDSPLWGPLHAPHHWGESIFGYYLTRDEAVLRKHAQMLSDAGVDVVIFDVTNQITYRDDYMTLLRVWAHERELGNPTPRVAFLTPFWAPAKVTRELWRDLYKPGLYRDLWFEWEGKPLILADDALISSSKEQSRQDTPTELRPGHTLGQSFTVQRPILSVAGRFPTWNQSESSVTLTLRRGGHGGEIVAMRRFTNIHDNDWLRLGLGKPAQPGGYYLEASEPQGKVGWWSSREDKLAGGEAFADGMPAAGDRTLRIEFSDAETAAVKDFFTFRKPQPDYFRGPTQANMWSWLEVYPQHRFTNSTGVNEEMSVGVAQNAVAGRLGSMSEPGARGRSFHDGATDLSPDAVRHGYNVQEEWDRVLRADPRFVFVTGWNEWIAGRFAEFNHVKLPVMFVDQFDEEYSRDIEPMRGGHGDDYYWQLAGNIRRYKGARPLPRVVPRPIRIDGAFEDWREVQPEFRDTINDPVERENRGWDPRVIYRNHSGRNDFIAAKMSWDESMVYFYVRTREPMSSPAGANWMNLLIDTDANSATGWMGYDFIVNYPEPGSLAKHAPNGTGFKWTALPEPAVKTSRQGAELELSIPWKVLGLNIPATLDFKWADNCFTSGTWTDFTLNGDAAPNDRFNYRALIR